MGIYATTTFILYFNVMPVYTCKSITVVRRLKGADDWFFRKTFSYYSVQSFCFQYFQHTDTMPY